MTDRLFIRHPLDPARNGYVTQTAFDALWSKKGYVIVGADPAEPLGDPQTATADELNAELDRRAADDPPDPEPDEKADLTARLEAAGVTVDRRWGLKRLRAEAALIGDPE